MPVAVKPIGVHDQLYKRLAVERWEEIDVLGAKNISLSLELKHRGGGTESLSPVFLRVALMI
jgi:hypothetical protein